MAVNYNQMSNKKNTLIVYELITVVLTGTAVAFQKYFFFSSLSKFIEFLGCHDQWRLPKVRKP